MLLNMRQRTAPHSKELLGPNVRSAEAERPWEAIITSQSPSGSHCCPPASTRHKAVLMNVESRQFLCLKSSKGFFISFRIKSKHFPGPSSPVRAFVCWYTHASSLTTVSLSVSATSVAKLVCAYSSLLRILVFHIVHGWLPLNSSEFFSTLQGSCIQILFLSCPLALVVRSLLYFSIAL